MWNIQIWISKTVDLLIALTKLMSCSKDHTSVQQLNMFTSQIMGLSRSKMILITLYVIAQCVIILNSNYNMRVLEIKLIDI